MVSPPSQTRIEVMWKMGAVFVGANVKTCGNVHSRDKKGGKNIWGCWQQESFLCMSKCEEPWSFPFCAIHCAIRLPLSTPITIPSIALITRTAVGHLWTLQCEAQVKRKRWKKSRNNKNKWEKNKPIVVLLAPNNFVGFLSFYPSTA